MAKYNAKGVYGVLFTTLDNLSESDQEYLFENVFTEKFLENIKENPKSAYSVLNNIVIDIEKGKTNKGDIVENIGIMNFDLEYMPNYQESDWLEQNRIWSIGIDFEVTTFMIGNFNPLPDRDANGNPMPLHVAKNVLLEFFSAKKLNYDNYMDSEQMEWILTKYFDNQD